MDRCYPKFSRSRFLRWGTIIFRSSLRDDLIKPVTMSVRTYVRPSSRFVSDLNETCVDGRGQWVVHVVPVWPWCKVNVKVASLTKIEIRPTLPSISSQDMNHGCELASDSETRDQYEISLGPDFRYQSRVTFHVTSKMARKAVTMKLNGVDKTVRLYAIWIENDETYATI